MIADAIKEDTLRGPISPEKTRGLVDAVAGKTKQEVSATIAQGKKLRDEHSDTHTGEIVITEVLSEPHPDGNTYIAK